MRFIRSLYQVLETPLRNLTAGTANAARTHALIHPSIKNHVERKRHKKRLRSLDELDLVLALSQKSCSYATGKGMRLDRQERRANTID